MAIAKVPKELSDPSGFLGDHTEFGRPLFAQLVPFAVHIAASIYEERRDRLINTRIIDELENLSTKIHDTLRSLGLPGSLQALEKPLGLPASLLSHAEEVRQADALTRLQRSFADTEKLRGLDVSVFTEGKEVLRAEKVEDDRLRMKYGTDRWVRPDSKSAAEKLYAQVNEVDGYLKSAASSDELVRTKHREYEDMLRILSSTDRDIGNFVPSSRRVTIPPKVEAEAGKLRTCLNNLNRLESRRRRKIESIREKAKKDDINSAILAEAGRLEREYPGTQIAPANFEDFFENHLARYDLDIEAVRTELTEQEDLIEQLEAVNAAFVSARKGDTGSREREQALQKLENAFFEYKKIISNIEAGRKFYNELSKIVGRFRDDCKSFSYSRQSEAAQLES
jgi:programmed cell death 6-interacting protein